MNKNGWMHEWIDQQWHNMFRNLVVGIMYEYLDTFLLFHIFLVHVYTSNVLGAFKVSALLYFITNFYFIFLFIFFFFPFFYIEEYRHNTIRSNLLFWLYRKIDTLSWHVSFIPVLLLGPLYSALCYKCSVYNSVFIC